MKKIYWGWFVVGGGFISLMLSYGSRYSFGVFVKPMVTDYQWPMTIISLGASINLAAYSFMSILTGKLLDHIAPKWILTCGALMAAVGFVITSQVKTPLGFYLAYGLLVGAGFSGCGLVVTGASVGKWFVRKKGLAMGVSSMGIGVGTIVMAPLANHIVMQYGWQNGFLSIAVLIFVVGIGVSQFVMSKKGPEELGLLPDGDPCDDSNQCNKEESGLDEAGSIMSVLKSKGFQILAICNLLACIVVMMVFVHQIAYAVDNQIDKVQAAAAVGVLGIFGSIGKFFFGWFGDKIRDAKYSASLGFFMMSMGLFILYYAQTAFLLYLFAIVFGFGYGSMAPMMPYLVSELFGRRLLGTIYGWLTFFSAGIGGSIGPVLGGFIYDHSGSYALGWLLCFIMLLISTILILALGPKELKSTK